jgi:hypothetical protein
VRATTHFLPIEDRQSLRNRFTRISIERAIFAVRLAVGDGVRPANNVCMSKNVGLPTFERKIASISWNYNLSRQGFLNFASAQDSPINLGWLP